ncbi:DNA repair protein RadC [Oscillospiraceae bacterium OttesenSCG-928-F05]|nr:DNA repair protein RadC [Oscillospiraceae bacterium OttesenSCG-928-F05]
MADKPGNPHAGHRKRLKNRYLTEGLDGFQAHNVLELLLFYALPQGDTNPLAHELIQRFGSLSAVFDTDYSELIKVKGLGEHAALLIKLIPDLGRYYNISKQDFGVIINSTRQAGEYLMPRFHGYINEVVMLVCLDAKCKVLSTQVLVEGELNSARISTRKIIETVLRVNATSVIMAHNHTSGVAVPSREDVDVTKEIGEALAHLDVLLIDHIIIADDDFVSMKDSGML